MECRHEVNHAGCRRCVSCRCALVECLGEVRRQHAARSPSRGRGWCTELRRLRYPERGTKGRPGCSRRRPRIRSNSRSALFHSARGPPGVPGRYSAAPEPARRPLLVDLAVQKISGGEDPESVLVLTQSRRAATQVREQITAGLLGYEQERGPQATREPLVRTVHSYAFAVLRLQAAAHGNAPPRLITGAEQDSVLREMLRGDIEDGALRWPERLRPALGLNGFAVELRDLMLRGERARTRSRRSCQARQEAWPSGVGGGAGRFAEAYEQGVLLRGSVGVEAPEATAPALDAAELIGAALTPRSPPIPNCFAPSALGSGTYSSTTHNIWIRRRRSWFG